MQKSPRLNPGARLLKGSQVDVGKKGPILPETKSLSQ